MSSSELQQARNINVHVFRESGKGSNNRPDQQKALPAAKTVGRAATTQACPSEWLGHVQKRLPVTNSKGA